VDPNLVDDGINGWLFASENVEECAKKMLEAYNNKEKLAEMAATGKEKVLETHTYEHLIQLYQQSYYELLAK
jgi:glycosyltransferase involved in cell wall biosynthesis